MRRAIFAAVAVLAIKEYMFPGYITSVVVGLTETVREVKSEFDKDKKN
jgi:hypothetical protein